MHRNNKMQGYFFLIFMSILISIQTNAQSDFSGVTDYEFELPEVTSGKIYIVASDDLKSPIEIKKSSNGKWAATGRQARQISDYLNKGKTLNIIDGKISKFQINKKTEIIQSLNPDVAVKKGRKRIFEAQENDLGNPKFKNTSKRKRTRSLQETEF